MRFVLLSASVVDTTVNVFFVYSLYLRLYSCPSKKQHQYQYGTSVAFTDRKIVTFIIVTYRNVGCKRKQQLLEVTTEKMLH